MFDHAWNANDLTDTAAAPANGGTTQPAPAIPTPVATDAPANPFAGAQSTAPPPGSNPFAAPTQQAAPPAQQPAAAGQQQPARTGIPVAQRGGTVRGGRGSSIPQRGGRGGNFQARNASGGAALNPGATNFQPNTGNKRPSEAGEGGQNPKRQQRGGRGGPNRGGA